MLLNVRSGEIKKTVVSSLAFPIEASAHTQLDHRYVKVKQL